MVSTLIPRRSCDASLGRASQPLQSTSCNLASTPPERVVNRSARWCVSNVFAVVSKREVSPVDSQKHHEAKAADVVAQTLIGHPNVHKADKLDKSPMILDRQMDRFLLQKTSENSLSSLTGQKLGAWRLLGLLVGSWPLRVPGEPQSWN